MYTSFGRSGDKKVEEQSKHRIKITFYPALIGGRVALVVVTYLTLPPEKEVNDKFFAILDRG